MTAGKWEFSIGSSPLTDASPQRARQVPTLLFQGARDSRLGHPGWHQCGRGLSSRAPVVIEVFCAPCWVCLGVPITQFLTLSSGTL